MLELIKGGDIFQLQWREALTGELNGGGHSNKSEDDVFSTCLMFFCFDMLSIFPSEEGMETHIHLLKAIFPDNFNQAEPTSWDIWELYFSFFKERTCGHLIGLCDFGRVDLANKMLRSIKMTSDRIVEEINERVIFKNGGCDDGTLQVYYRKGKGMYVRLCDYVRKHFSHEHVNFKFEEGVGTFILAEHHENDNSLANKHQQLTWKGTPAQLGFIVNLLAEKGYLDLLPSCERNAELLLGLFNIAGTQNSKGSMSRILQALKRDELPINADDAAKFQKIPNRSDLRK